VRRSRPRLGGAIAPIAIGVSAGFLVAALSGGPSQGSLSTALAPLPVGMTAVLGPVALPVPAPSAAPHSR
jgi:hypothetical protein